MKKPPPERIPVGIGGDLGGSVTLGRNNGLVSAPTTDLRQRRWGGAVGRTFAVCILRTKNPRRSFRIVAHGNSDDR